MPRRRIKNACISKIASSSIFVKSADPGFDSDTFRKICSEKEMEVNIKENPGNKKRDKGGLQFKYFDEELYKRRFKIEHANAWMDAFKALLIRFETKLNNWMA